MKKALLVKYFICIYLISSLSIRLSAQTVGLPYSFAATTPAIAVPTTLWNSIAVPVANRDNSISAAPINPPGFSFPFAGTLYNGFYMSTNGWLALTNGAGAAPAFYTGALPNNLLANNTGGLPMIAPLWDDLSSAGFQWQMLAGDLWVRWSSSNWDKSNPAATNFAAKLSPALGTITIVHPNSAYNPMTAPSVPSASIGIAGACVGEYFSASNQSLTTATVSSTAENTTLGNATANNFRPSNINYVFTPVAPANDDCAGAISIGNVAVGAACALSTNFANIHATLSGPAICATADVKDVWFSVIKNAGVQNLTITTAPGSCNSVTGTSVQVYASCGGLSLGCSSTGTTYPTYGEVTMARPCAAETLLIRVTSDGDLAGRFQICGKDGGAAAGTGATCATATPICALPYSYSGTTAGFGADYDSANSACHDPFMNGEDYLFSYTPPANICLRVAMTSPGVNPGVFIFDGCPNLGTTHCIASAINSTGNCNINSVSLVAGTTYYFLVDNDTLGSAPFNIPFSINITQLGSAPSNDACGATNLGTINNNQACVFSSYTTECATPSSLVYPAPGCGNYTNNITGDIWLTFTAGFTGSLLVKTQPGTVNSSTDIGMAVYTGNCITLNLVACDDNSAGSNMPLLSLAVTNAVTYYVRLWTVAPGSTGNFDLCFSSACTPPNDLPCQAVLVNLGGTASGFNTCASATNEPLNAAQCVAGGIINTVWYKAVVPASLSLKIRTHTHSLTDTQIQAYTSPSMGCVNYASFVSRGCNDDGPDCGSGGGQSWHDFSDLTVNGLTAGDTLYIAVDGFGSLTGTFDITIIDGASATFPPIAGADCLGAISVCGSSNITVNDPGILGYGNICDFSTNYNCWANPERNSAWYTVTVNPGTLQFDVQTFSDYDFIMWDITGISNPCAQIQTISLPSIRCNWVTTVGGHTGISIPDPDASWEPAITVSGTPHTYLILIDNWNPPFQTTGYTINWMGSPISSTTTSVTWQGVTDTLFSQVSNWGVPPCNAVPTCAIDATIASAGTGMQPTIAANMSVKDLTINAGGSLRIKSPYTLDVCGNFTNNGVLIAEPGSTVRFSGTGTQVITGSLTGTNAFANFTVTKASGVVQLASNIDVKEDFLTSNINSVFNINGKYLKVAGDFTNYNRLTFIGTPLSTVEFNGTTNQIFTNTADSVSFKTVKMNNPSGKLMLTGANSKLIVDSILILTAGNIVTTPALEVSVKNGVATAITSHSPASYVEGRLRRKVFVGIMDFPVGNSLVPNAGAGNGYELANITFTTGTVVPDLLAWFNLWPGPVPIGPTTFDFCLATPAPTSYTTSYGALPFLDHGYWSFQRTSAFFNGNYNVTLNNTGGTNNTGTIWTVASAPLAAPPLVLASWTTPMLGTCTIPSTYAITKRNQINTPASTSNSFNHLYASIQSLVALPIELLYFAAEPKGENVVCTWETASETNNDYFEVERSVNGSDFIPLLPKVKGFGNGISTTNRSYSFTDYDHCKEMRYYRLKQTDIDGRFSYSDVIAIDCSIDKKHISIFPNPANSSITVRFYENNNDDVIIRIIDITGREVRHEKLSTEKGYNTIINSVEDLSSGIYYLQIKSSSEDQYLRQVKFSKY